MKIIFYLFPLVLIAQNNFLEVNLNYFPTILKTKFSNDITDRYSNFYTYGFGYHLSVSQTVSAGLTVEYGEKNILSNTIKVTTYENQEGTGEYIYVSENIDYWKLSLPVMITLMETNYFHMAVGTSLDLAQLTFNGNYSFVQYTGDELKFSFAPQLHLRLPFSESSAIAFQLFYSFMNFEDFPAQSNSVAIPTNSNDDRSPIQLAYDDFTIPFQLNKFNLRLSLQFSL
ncbi:MAG: hypothetical protein KDD94_01180 [Calditrichaeota bacterium]|nr:hypothetical protein [Calditrichota bacterium]